VSGSYRICFCSPLRRDPDTVTWHGALDVSQRTEPDVRPLGCVASAFSADKARRLSIPLAGDVPPRHLMSPVHSTGRRCVASAFNETCPFCGQAATSPFRRRRACPFHLQVVHPYCCMHYAHHHSRVTKEAAATYQYCMDYGYHGARRLLRRTRIGYFYNVFPPFCSWAHMSELSILVRSLNPRVFLCSSRIHLAGKTLRPLLILGFRAGAFRHPAGEFPLRQCRCDCSFFSLFDTDREIRKNSKWNCGASVAYQFSCFSE
jgi:hypothetical protein